MAAAQFRSAHLGRETLGAGLRIPRHRHEGGYVAVVLSGGYLEAGLAGRFSLRAGHVAVHRPFDAHLDQVERGGAQILNLPLPPGACLPPVFRIGDPDAIARIAERDAQAAAEELEPAEPIAGADDWPDLLAAAVVRRPEARLADWAEAHGLAAETLSRGFRRAYGVTPARFRSETRAQRALQLILETSLPLAAIAAECGFSDQPHLNRVVAQLTGRSPGAWRRGSIPFKTGEAAPR